MNFDPNHNDVTRTYVNLVNPYIYICHFNIPNFGMSVMYQNAQAELRGPNMCILKVSLGWLKPTCDTRVIHLDYMLRAPLAYIYVCVYLALYSAYHPSHPPVKPGSQRNQHRYPLPTSIQPDHEASSNSSYFAGLKDPPCQRKCMHRTSEVLLLFV